MRISKALDETLDIRQMDDDRDQMPVRRRDQMPNVRRRAGIDTLYTELQTTRRRMNKPAIGGETLRHVGKNILSQWIPIPITLANVRPCASTQIRQTSEGHVNAAHQSVN